MKLKKLTKKLLDHSCSNPAYTSFGNVTFGNPKEEGYNVHRVDLCCVLFYVTAKKTKGKWKIKKIEKKTTDQSRKKKQTQNNLGEIEMIDPTFTDKFYTMDPYVDDLLFDGTELKNGMVVLLENEILKARVNPEEGNDEYSKYENARAQETNRWCEVQRITITPRYNKHGHSSSPLISFLAIYADGSKKKRSYDSSYAWYVKKDSMKSTDQEVKFEEDHVPDSWA